MLLLLLYNICIVKWASSNKTNLYKQRPLLWNGIIKMYGFISWQGPPEHSTSFALLGQTKDCCGVNLLPHWSEYSLYLQIYLRFMEYQMEYSNECKKNFVAVYDGSSAIENLKAKFCSTVANDVMLDNGVGVVRMWADEKSRLSRFRMLFTSFVDRECLFFGYLTLPGSCFSILFHHFCWIVSCLYHSWVPLWC